MPIWRKVEKPHSFVILRGLKGLEEIKNFLKNPLGTFLSPIHVLPNCQISENSEVPILRYRVTDEQRTEGQT